MDEALPYASIVVPLLNERATVEELVRRVRESMQTAGLSFELLLVDDGSRDGSAELLRRLETEDARLRVFELTRNFGQAAAVACGLFAARGEVVITLDGDLQNPPEEIPKLLEPMARGADIVTARRGFRHESFLRWLGSRGIHWLARQLTGVTIDDFGGNFKAYRRNVIEATRQIWAPGKPFFPLALWLGFPVAEVTVRHDPRRAGGSRYTLLSLLRINLDLITSFTTLPLALVGLAGAVCLVVGALGIAGCWWFGSAGWFAPAAALTIFAVGAMLAAAGVLGQYLARVYRQVAGNGPAYVVKRGPRATAE